MSIRQIYKAPKVGGLGWAKQTALTADLVAYGPYGLAINSGGGSHPPDTTRHEYWMDENLCRVIENCTVRAVRIHINSTVVVITELKIRFWRSNGVTWDMVAESEDFSPLATGTNTYTLATPLTGIQRGDAYSIVVKLSSSTNRLNARSLASCNGRHRSDTAIDTTSAVDWPAETTGQIAGGGIPVLFYDYAPSIVAFGDSWCSGTIGAGTDGDSGYCVATTAATHGSTYSASWPGKLAALTGLRVMKFGIHGDEFESGSARTRFTADTVSRRPKCVIILVGGNDCRDGAAVSAATYEGYIDGWADELLTAGIKCIWLGLGPYSNATQWVGDDADHGMQLVDAFNAKMKTVASTHGHRYIDLMQLLGKTSARTGADSFPLNKWDMLDGSGGTPDYNSDDQHTTEIGYAKIAAAIYDELQTMG